MTNFNWENQIGYISDLLRLISHFTGEINFEWVTKTFLKFFQSEYVIPTLTNVNWW